jgi:hypothetical protein
MVLGLHRKMKLRGTAEVKKEKMESDKIGSDYEEWGGG